MQSEVDVVAAEEPTYQDEERAEVAGGWAIETLTDADWALKRLGELEREAAENAKVLEDQIAMLKARNERLTARLTHGLKFFRSRLQFFAESHRAELLGTGKKKSRALHFGSIGWRKTGGGLKVVDADALLAWARTQPVEMDLVRITEAPAINEVKKLFKVSGEVPPGTDVEPEAEEFIVKTEGGSNEH